MFLNSFLCRVNYKNTHVQFRSETPLLFDINNILLIVTNNIHSERESPDLKVVFQLAGINSIPEPKNMSESSCDSTDSTQPLTTISQQSHIMSIDEHRDEIMEKILEKPPEASIAPVKLVISKKKGSIFKSRSMVPDTDGGKKRRALYKHKWCTDDRDSTQVR